MTRPQKILTGVLWLLAIVASVTFIAAKTWRGRAEHEAPALPVLAEVPAFDLVDQDNHPLTEQTLRGRPWVGAFFFTTCGTACPMMSAKMAKLQTAIPEKDVHLVSVTVNPEFDSPEVLKAYAKKFDADETRWHFLTGKTDAVSGLARGMLLNVIPPSGESPVLHSEKFVLVDADGKMRAVYDSKDDEQLKQLSADAQTLAAEARTGGRHG